MTVKRLNADLQQSLSILKWYTGTLMVEKVSTSETSADFCHITRDATTQTFAVCTTNLSRWPVPGLKPGPTDYERGVQSTLEQSSVGHAHINIYTYLCSILSRRTMAGRSWQLRWFFLWGEVFSSVWGDRRCINIISFCNKVNYLILNKTYVYIGEIYFKIEVRAFRSTLFA
jgi:hypothetical protein